MRIYRAIFFLLLLITEAYGQNSAKLHLSTNQDNKILSLPIGRVGNKFYFINNVMGKLTLLSVDSNFNILTQVRQDEMIDGCKYVNTTILGKHIYSFYQKGKDPVIQLYVVEIDLVNLLPLGQLRQIINIKDRKAYEEQMFPTVGNVTESGYGLKLSDNHNYLLFYSQRISDSTKQRYVKLCTFDTLMRAIASYDFIMPFEKSLNRCQTSVDNKGDAFLTGISLGVYSPRDYLLFYLPKKGHPLFLRLDWGLSVERAYGLSTRDGRLFVIGSVTAGNNLASHLRIRSYSVDGMLLSDVKGEFDPEFFRNDGWDGPYSETIWGYITVRGYYDEERKQLMVIGTGSTGASGEDICQKHRNFYVSLFSENGKRINSLLIPRFSGTEYDFWGEIGTSQNLKPLSSIGRTYFYESSTGVTILFNDDVRNMRLKEGEQPFFFYEADTNSAVVIYKVHNDLSVSHEIVYQAKNAPHTYFVYAAPPCEDNEEITFFLQYFKVFETSTIMGIGRYPLSN